MTQKEFKEKIINNEYSDEFNSYIVNINYSHLNYSIDIENLSSIYNFVDRQNKGWNKEEMPSYLENSKDYFKRIKSQILDLVNSNHNDLYHYDYDVNRKWKQIKNRLEASTTDQGTKVFTSDSPETDFLQNIFNENPNHVEGAYYYLTNKDITVQSNDIFNGLIKAYEFREQGKTNITKRLSNEKTAISNIRNSFENYISDNESKLDLIISKSNENVNNQQTRFENLISQKKRETNDLISDKKEEFNDWFENSKNNLEEFKNLSSDKILELENTYEVLLKLKKPASYWNTRASVLKKEGWKAINWLIFLVIFTCITLYLLLWLTPEGMLLSFIKGNASAIKWSIIYVTFISFLAYGIKALHKVAFSSFHLARDAEEKEQLTYVYLSLLKDNAVDEKDKNLILQSLFSRADTGLLKDDNGPTMPNDIAGKFFGK